MLVGSWYKLRNPRSGGSGRSNTGLRMARPLVLFDRESESLRSRQTF
jgi:hypothetical protein